MFLGEIFYKFAYASHLYSQYAYWLYNSPFSIIFYPIVSLWRYLMNQTIASFQYLFQLVWHYKSLNWYHNLTFKRIFAHFKIYTMELFSEIYKEIKLILNILFEVIFYPFIGLSWYFKKTFNKF
jgi:hypothetical protein